MEAENNDPSEVLRRLGPAVERHRLLAAGVTVHDIAVGVRTGTIHRLRRAWYGTPDTPYDVRIAVGYGGRLGGFSAAGSYGLWRGLDTGIHVSWNPHGNIANRGRAHSFPVNRTVGPTQIVSHWTINAPGFASPDPLSPWRETVSQTLAQVLVFASAQDAVACVDSALHNGLISPEEVGQLFSYLPRRVRPLERYVDSRSDSGIETAPRMWLQANDIPFLVHPVILGVGEVDFLIGKSLIMETDGEFYHSDPASFEKDRRRDNASGTLGYVTVRPSYKLLMHDWPSVERRLLTHIAAGDHLRDVRGTVIPSPPFKIVSPEIFAPELIRPK